jgi:hypothetical protein
MSVVDLYSSICNALSRVNQYPSPRELVVSFLIDAIDCRTRSLSG